jgi:hypothetical protein
MNTDHNLNYDGTLLIKLVNIIFNYWLWSKLPTLTQFRSTIFSLKALPWSTPLLVPRQFHDDEFTLVALNTLVWCMTRSSACCTAMTPTALTTCSKTQGPYAEFVNSFPLHPGIGSKSPIVSYPVNPTTVRSAFFIFFDLGTLPRGKNRGQFFKRAFTPTEKLAPTQLCRTGRHSCVGASLCVGANSRLREF